MCTIYSSSMKLAVNKPVNKKKKKKWYDNYICSRFTDC